MLKDTEVGATAQIADIHVNIRQHDCQYNKYIYPCYHYDMIFIWSTLFISHKLADRKRRIILTGMPRRDA